MALADYRLCDVCDDKVFYDSNLNYEQGESEYRESTFFKTCGKEQPGELSKYKIRLDYLGDWAVICDNCSKTHKCIVVEISTEEK